MKETTLPTVSVVICTLNREESLLQVLRLLKDQTVRPLEILVIDQSTRPAPKFQAFLEEAGKDIRRLSLSPPSTTAARNLSIREVRGEIVLYLDDDVLFQPDLIRSTWRIIPILQSGPSPGKSCTTAPWRTTNPGPPA